MKSEIIWTPCELHTHTVHSDGAQTLEQLVMASRDLGLDIVAVTDHNTIAAHREIADAVEKSGVRIIRGMEWTTFYGHLVVLGTGEYVDWRDITPTTIHEGLRSIHKSGALAGMAHPYRIGSPLCTGCFWEFNITDWNEIDYMEVWSEPFPSTQDTNLRALEKWNKILNDGYRLTGLSGRDWHAPTTVFPIAVTWLGLETPDDESQQALERSVCNAIKKGRSVSTMGPMINFVITDLATHAQYGIGDEMPKPSGLCEVRVDLDFSVRQSLWTLDSEPLTVMLIANGTPLVEYPVMPDNAVVSDSIQLSGYSWIRAELWGSLQGKQCMLAFSNPVYLRGK